MTALTWTSNAPLVTVIDPVTSGLMAQIVIVSVTDQGACVLLLTPTVVTSAGWACWMSSTFPSGSSTGDAVLTMLRGRGDGSSRIWSVTPVNCNPPCAAGDGLARQVPLVADSEVLPHVANP